MANNNKPVQNAKGEASNDVRAQIDKALKAVEDKFPNVNLRLQKEALIKVFEQGMKPMDALGFDKTHMDKLYAEAFRLFQNGQYKNAKNMFGLLKTLDPKEGKYVFANGCCWEKLGELEFALIEYMYSCVLDAKNPLTYYRVADCMLLLDYPSHFIRYYLKKTIEAVKEEPVYLIIGQRAEALLNGLDAEEKTVSK